MASTVLDSALFRDSFGTPAMRAIFEDAALLARYTEVEVALARAQGRLGVIPAQAARDIAHYLENPKERAPKSAMPEWGGRPRSRYPLPPGPPLG